VLFYVKYPEKLGFELITQLLRKAVATATKKGHLRENLVDTLSGKMTKTNLGPGSPVLYIQPWKKNHVEVRLVLKGAGCENVGTQYSLPDMRLNAGRDLKGVKKCILDAVQQAQGRGCGPGILGVTIGGDRATGYHNSKEQFLRKMTDKNSIPELSALERECTEEANSLGIGPMGLGGKSTLLGVKVGVLHRLPGSYHVTVSYMCWAFRRQGANISPKGEIQKWLY
jgi:fumarate hydratase class I